MNVVMTICDPGDEVIIFTPYYFNHLMALQLISVTPVLAPCLEDFTPDLNRLPGLITDRTKAIVLISPNNPTGAVAPEQSVASIQRLCEERGTSLYPINTYHGSLSLSTLSEKVPIYLSSLSFDNVCTEQEYG